MTLKMKQILPPEIDTKMDSDKQHSVAHHGSSGNISFREADTPKHCNKGDKGKPWIINGDRRHDFLNTWNTNKLY